MINNEIGKDISSSYNGFVLQFDIFCGLNEPLEQIIECQLKAYTKTHIAHR
ncbi:12852_t:CDS:2 [Acaulospora colombiana]|uniref:12852_t:CDS:1 n=1 Tax=Acaulospora colombiana TaxID=27376 RepID=A0ACA9KRF9_9GLOM|nr:12852_t:CDS:2 [Acaulospora colombiana]